MDDLVHYDYVRIPDKYRLHNQFQIRMFSELDEIGDFDLSPVEKRWSEDYEYLLSHGYQLRPRFHPGWTPTWRGTNLSPLACEDSIMHYVCQSFCLLLCVLNHSRYVERFCY